MEKLLLNGDIPVNCYIIYNGNKCFIVDPGYEKDVIVKYIKDRDLEVVGILLTHGHIDHIGAIDCFNVPVYIHEDEYEVLEFTYNEGFEYYNREKTFDILNINIVKINENTILKLGDKNITVIHTKGHTKGGVCYKVDNNLYTGDTLFKGLVGKWTYYTGSLNDLKKSVVDIIETHEDNINVYPGHGESTTIGSERLNNYYYKKWSSISNK